MNDQLEEYYLRHPEPFQGCLLALKQLILNLDERITHERKYQIPFFCFRGEKTGFSMDESEEVDAWFRD